MSLNTWIGAYKDGCDIPLARLAALQVAVLLLFLGNHLSLCTHRLPFLLAHVTFVLTASGQRGVCLTSASAF